MNKVTQNQRAAAMAVSRAQAQAKSRRLAGKAALDAAGPHLKRKGSAPGPDVRASKAARTEKQVRPGLDLGLFECGRRPGEGGRRLKPAAAFVLGNGRCVLWNESDVLEVS